MNSDEHRQAIELEIRNFGAAAARKDYLGVAGFFTKDAKILAPGVPVVRDRRRYRNFGV